MLSGFRPYVVTPWGTDITIDAQASLLQGVLTRASLRRAALVITDARYLMGALERSGVPRRRRAFVTFGVDLTTCAPDLSERKAWRRKAGFADDTEVVVSSRTLTPIHDVGTFIRAAQLVYNERPQSRFVVVADGPDRAGLEALTSELGLAPATRFTGYVDEAEMIAWLRASDIYVSTSLTDAGIAASTAEAMACALPVVHTDNGENGSWVGDGAGGFLAPNGDAAAVARGILNLAASPALRESCGVRNRRVVEVRNNRAVEMHKVDLLYRRVSAQAHERRSS